MSTKRDTWVRPLFLHYRVLSIFGVVFGVIAVLFSGALMFTSGYMISLAACLPLTVLALHLPSIFVRIFGIGKPLIDYVQRLGIHDWVLRATSSLRCKLYLILEKKNSSVIEAKRSGELLALFAEDIEHVQNLCIRSIFPYLIALIVYVIVCLALGVFNVFVGLFALVMLGVVLIVVPCVSLGAVRPAYRRRQALKSQMYVSASESIQGVSDWVLSGREADFLAGFCELQGEIAIERVHSERLRRWRSVFVQGVVALSIAGVFIFASFAFGEQISELQSGAVSALSGVSAIDSTAVAANWIAAFVLCAFPIFETLSRAPEDILAASSHERAIENLNSLDVDDCVAQSACEHMRSSVLNCECGSGANHVRDAGRLQPEDKLEVEPDICMKNVCFSYQNSNRELFDHFTLNIPFGEHVAVLGKSGSGKSTLARMIYGELAPTSGEIRVGGVAPSFIEEPHKTMGVLYQNAYIFDASLRENLLVANGRATDAELVDALEKVGLGDLLTSSRGGLDIHLGEGGEHLSGGQRQRVALARMLLVDTPIVLLDEPFLWVDAETEAELDELIYKIMAGRTVVLITHHDIDTAHYDQVVHL